MDKRAQQPLQLALTLKAGVGNAGFQARVYEMGLRNGIQMTHDSKFGSVVSWIPAPALTPSFSFVS